MAWTNKKFRAELMKGYLWQLYVAQIFRENGYEVSVPPLTHGNAKDFKDEEDILVAGQVVECKSRNLEFSCAEDFPYDTVLVDTVESWESKTRKPIMYVCISQLTGAIIALDVAKNRKNWTETTLWDSVRRYRVHSYEAPRQCWGPLEIIAKRLLG